MDIQAELVKLGMSNVRAAIIRDYACWCDGCEDWFVNGHCDCDGGNLHCKVGCPCNVCEQVWKNAPGCYCCDEYKAFSTGQDETNRAIIEAEFPDCMFTVCIDVANLNDDMGRGEIAIQLSCKCYCFAEIGHRNLSVCVKPTGDNESVKVREAIHALANVYGPGWSCNHRFLEAFDEVTPGVFDVFMGS